MLNMYAKFEVSSFNYSRDIEGAQNFKGTSRGPFPNTFDLILNFFVSTHGGQCACQICEDSSSNGSRDM